MMVTEEMVWKQLKTVPDPELGINLVDLGLIYKVVVKEEIQNLNQVVFSSPEGSFASDSSFHSEPVAQDDDVISMTLPIEVEEKRSVTVDILMTLTSPACPLAGMFDELVGGAVRKLPGVSSVKIEITFDPPWSFERVSEEAKAELGWF